MNWMPKPLSDVAREMLLEITPAETIGEFVSEVTEAEGVVTIQFESALAGYPGWKWTVSLAVLPDAEPTVLETELIPGEGALLAPDWVPWSDRLADYKAAQDAAASSEDAEDSDSDESEDSEEDDDDEDDDHSSDVLHGGDLDGVDIDDLDTSEVEDDDSDETVESDDDDSDELDDSDDDDSDEDDSDEDDSDDDDSDDDDDPDEGFAAER